MRSAGLGLVLSHAWYAGHVLPRGAARNANEGFVTFTTGSAVTAALITAWIALVAAFTAILVTLTTTMYAMPAVPLMMLTALISSQGRTLVETSTSQARHMSGWLPVRRAFENGGQKVEAGECLINT